MNELAVLFKDLSHLVVEQGTVLDRIDYNLQKSKTNMTKANKELDKTL
jgi:syntaxin 16